jgi:hypothetical protein
LVRDSIGTISDNGFRSGILTSLYGVFCSAISNGILYNPGLNEARQNNAAIRNNGTSALLYLDNGRNRVLRSGKYGIIAQGRSVKKEEIPPNLFASPAGGSQD